MQATLPTTSISDLPVELITRILEYAVRNHVFKPVTRQLPMPDTLQVAAATVEAEGTAEIEGNEVAEPIPTDTISIDRSRRQLLCTTSLIRPLRAISQALMWNHVTLVHQSEPVERGNRMLVSPACGAFITQTLRVHSLPGYLRDSWANRREYQDLIRGLLHNLKGLASLTLFGVVDLEPSVFGSKNLSKLSALNLVGLQCDPPVLTFKMLSAEQQEDLVDQRHSSPPPPPLTATYFANTSPDLDWSITLPFHLSSFKLAGKIGPNILTSIIRSSPQLQSLMVIGLQRLPSTMAALADALAKFVQGLRHLQLRSSYGPEWDIAFPTFVKLESLTITTYTPATVLATILPLLPSSLKSLTIVFTERCHELAPLHCDHLRQQLLLVLSSALLDRPLAELEELAIAPFKTLFVPEEERGVGGPERIDLRDDLYKLVLRCQQRGVVIRDETGKHLLP
ncbi:hypothetical protein P7C70_g1859, partial [Phenoliferia sp. Uapishka_3]